MSDSVEPVSVLPARFTLVLHEGREKAFFFILLQRERSVFQRATSILTV